MRSQRTAPKSTTAKRPRNSEDTRARILAAARARFAADGYDRATIRSVASDAGVDPALVMRYFGSKDELFATAATFELRIPDLRNAPKSRVGEALVRHFLDRWESGTDHSLQILLRTAASNEDAAARMRALVTDEVGRMVTRVRGKRGHETVAALIAAQMLGLAYARYILRLPALVAMSRDSIVRSVGATVQNYLRV